MPLLEAPAEYTESSPEHSLQPEFPIILAPLPGPAALAQLRLPPAEVRHNFGLPQEQQQQQQQQLHLQHPIERQNRRNFGRRNSFDRDVTILEETEHFPAFVHLLPVVLPPQLPEPTLDELLRRVTQRTDLEHVESVRLRVISYSISLSRLSLFLPRLQQLDLSGSVLSSLRDLGYGLMQLTHLNISNCGLNSFDGTSGLPAVKVLIADGNMIQRIGPLTELTQLQVLQARNNRISELGLLSFLGLCAQLREVELGGNPVCRLPLYRDTLRRSVATLQLLDGQPIDVEQESPNTIGQREDEQSSLSSDSESAARPATAPYINSNNNNNRIESFYNQRPATALVSLNSAQHHRQSPTSITSTPVAGSMLGLVRQRRRRSGHAWVSSSSGSSSSSSAASTRAPSISSSHSSLDLHTSSYVFSARGTLD